MIRTDLKTRSSTATKCLERVWTMLRTVQPCLPEVVIVIHSPRGKRRKLGHFLGCVWQAAEPGGGHEVGVSPELFESPGELLGTLLHEAAHALLYEWGLNAGCGPDGYYHREEFRNVCRKLGLECEFTNKRYGWSSTRWPAAGVPKQYQPLVELLRRDLPWGLRKEK